MSEPPEKDALLEEGRQLASLRDDLIAQGVDPSRLEIPRASSSGRGWWVISGDELHAALHRVADGDDPDIAYAELYANSDPGGEMGDA